MKKMALLVILVLAFPLAASAAIAPADQDVRFTVHNLAYNIDQSQGLIGSQRHWAALNAGNNQVCIFCHTPHNATRNAPLWNRIVNTGISYKMYTSSSTLSATAKGATLSSANESMMCLSCHDGKTAMNVIHQTGYREPGASTTPTGDAWIDMGFGLTNTAIGDIIAVPGNPSDLGAIRNSTGGIVGNPGDNLQDDHPVGFSYTTAVASKLTQYKTIATIDPSIRFFGPGKDRLECSSCHNPHNFNGLIYGGAANRGDIAVRTSGAVTSTQAQKDRTPFLVRDNNGSGLCLACHIK